MKRKNRILAAMLAGAVALLPSAVAEADTAFASYGALHVDGSKLVGADGAPVQLYGMSTHGMAWYPQYVSAETFRTLRDDWGVNCVRLAMYTDEHDGYCVGGDKVRMKALIDEGVTAASELGLYVIIDWHILRDETPLKYADEAEAFFAEMSARYADRANVLYEICNEPNGAATTWEDVTAYAERIIPVIRANAPEAVVLVGSPTWSQDIHLALAKPLQFDNVMYTLHFYAGTHKDDLRRRLTDCVEAGLPVFISEFGMCDASGNGALDLNSAAAWKALIDRYGLSYCCWNLSNCDESSAVLRHDCEKTANWTDADLNGQGIIIREWFKSET